MDDTRSLPFLAALGLDRSAGEREVRRAYAQRLKRIDPATEIAAFQALREAYESALAWVARPGHDAGASDVADVADAAAAEAGSSRPDGELGADASADISTDFSADLGADLGAPVAWRPARVAQERLAELSRVVAAPGTDEWSAAAALNAALADPRLLPMAERDAFEQGLAEQLVAGWQPGHEHLLWPACQAFQWLSDLRGPQRLGPVGQPLVRVLLQRDHYLQQLPHVVDARDEVLRRLRDPRPPSKRLLVEDMPLLELLAQAYPDYLRAVLPQAHLHQWQARYAALPASQRPPVPHARGDEPEDELSWGQVVLGLIALLCVLIKLFL